MVTAYLMNRTPHKALKMETLKTIHCKEADLLHLCVIGTKFLVDQELQKPRRRGLGSEGVRLLL